MFFCFFLSLLIIKTMSSSSVLVVSNKVNVGEDVTNVVEISGNQAQTYEYSADGNDYSSSIQFNNVVPVGSMSNTLVSRAMKLRYTIQFSTPGGTSIPSHLFPHGRNSDDVAAPPNSSFRAFPLQSISQNVQLALNSSTTTWNARQTLSPLLRLLEKDLLIKSAASCPTRPDDTFTLLTDGVGVGHVQSTANNVMNGYSRNSIKSTTYTVGPPLIWTFDVEEPLIFPGINTLHDNEAYLPNINQLSVILTYSNLQNDLFSSAPLYTGAPVFNPYGDSGNAVAAQNYTVTILTPRLCLTYLQVDPNLVKIPRQQITHFESVSFSTSQRAFNLNLNNPNAPLSVSSDTYRLTSCPKTMCIFLRLPIVGRTGYGALGSPPQGDACLSLNSLNPISINYGTRNGLLANCSVMELWNMSRECGSNQTYADFTTGSGSWLFIDPVKHFGLSPENGDIMPGESGSINMQITGSYIANNAIATLTTTANLFGAQNLEFVCVLVYAGQMVITPERVAYNLGYLSSSEIKTLMSSGSTVSSEAIEPTIQGRGLYTNKSVLTKGGKRRGGVMTAA